MKVVKYFVKLTVKNDKGDNQVKFKVVKHEKGEQGSKRKVSESDELPFRKMLNARKFVSEFAERKGIQCSQFEKEGDMLTKECTSPSGEKYIFQVRQQRIIKPKKEQKKEDQGSDKQEGKEAENKGEKTEEKTGSEEKKEQS